jgi:hypothetical protein
MTIVLRLMFVAAALLLTPTGTALRPIRSGAALVPTPIGVGLRYQPRLATHGPCVPGAPTSGRRFHLEIFAKGRVVILPAGIGLRDARFSAGRATGARCHAPVWTSDPTGVFRYTGTVTLGQVFRIWGKTLKPSRLLSFRGAVRLYRNGIRVDRKPGWLVLRARDELVLEVGGYVPPHHAYRFPR